MKEELEYMIELIEGPVDRPENYDSQEMHEIFIKLNEHLQYLLGNDNEWRKNIQAKNSKHSKSRIWIW